MDKITLTHDYQFADLFGKIQVLSRTDNAEIQKASYGMFKEMERLLFPQFVKAPKKKTQRVFSVNVHGLRVALNVTNFPKGYRKIPCIKLIREVTGAGLKDAKDFVEENNLHDSESQDGSFDIPYNCTLRFRRDNQHVVPYVKPVL